MPGIAVSEPTKEKPKDDLRSPTQASTFFLILKLTCVSPSAPPATSSAFQKSVTLAVSPLRKLKLTLDGSTHVSRCTRKLKWPGAMSVAGSNPLICRCAPSSHSPCASCSSVARSEHESAGSPTSSPLPLSSNWSSPPTGSGERTRVSSEGPSGPSADAPKTFSCPWVHFDPHVPLAHGLPPVHWRLLPLLQRHDSRTGAVHLKLCRAYLVHSPQHAQSPQERQRDAAQHAAHRDATARRAAPHSPLRPPAAAKRKPPHPSLAQSNSNDLFFLA
eukprot:scaffold282229_cov24-Tisochrysis_lutea.AAC.2